MIYPRDLSNMKFGNWTVIEPAFRTSKGITYFKCRCTCGEERNIARGNLVSGDSTSCGHDSNKDQLIDLTGRIFGELTALEYVKEEKKWLCKCSCGNEVLKRSWDLRNGKGKTCGVTENHTSKKLIDLRGNVFSELTVLEYAGDRNWKCQCSCGKILIVDGSKLRMGLKKSCGHTLNQNKRIDITGKTFGDLYVESYNTYGTYRCKCKCGNFRDVRTQELLNGKVTQCDECTKKRMQSKYDADRINLLGQKFGDLTVIGYKQDIHKWTCKCSCGKVFDVYGQHLRVGDTRSCGCKYGINSLYRSYLEMEVHQFIKERYKGNVISNTRGILSNNKELDIYLPDIKVAFEINGDFWHNDEHIDSKYHVEKVMECQKKDIRLIHIYEYEWLYNNNKIKQFIENIICDKQIIYARNTEIIPVNQQDAMNFLNKYHLQGYAVSSENIGLSYNNEIVALMTFGKPRFSNNADYEIIRLAFKNNIAVVGGTEKMFNSFIEKHRGASVESYCNIDKFSGAVYTKLGMKISGYSNPGYVWVNHKSNIVLTRYKTQKNKLVKLGLGTDDQTEDEIMKSHGYMKIYNSGNARYFYDDSLIF